MWPLKIVASVVLTTIVASGAVLLAQQAAAPPAGATGGQDQVAVLKQTLQEGLKKIRQYEWIETTAISLTGEEKARKQNRCYYGADGKLQKLSLDKASPAQAPAGGGGRRGRLKARIIENKKDEMQDYMQRAAALIHAYVPPDAARIQAAKAVGRIALDPKAPKGVRLVVSQYLLAGDSLAIGLDPATKQLLGLSVNTYLDKPDETVTLDVQMNTLPDGALYAAQTALDVKAKNIRVVIQNSGHRPMPQ